VGEGNVVEGFPRERARLLRVSRGKINRIAALLLTVTTKHDDICEKDTTDNTLTLETVA